MSPAGPSPAESAPAEPAPEGGARGPGDRGRPERPVQATGRTGRGQEWLLREAAASDIDRLVELEDLAFGEEAWSREMVAAELGGPDRRYFVVQAGGRVEGYAGLFLGWDVAEVMTIAVAPDWRGRGLGRALMEGILAEAALAGRRRVILEVAEGSEAAVGLYRWLGFEPIGRRRAYYQPSGRDALVMRLDLPG